MDSQNIKEPLCDFSFDDLEKLLKIDDEKCTTKTNITGEHVYDFSIKHKFGYLSNRRKSPLFALVDWGGNTHYDLRCWRNDGQPGKGITFNYEELLKLQNALKEFNFNSVYDNPIRQYKTENSKATFFV